MGSRAAVGSIKNKTTIFIITVTVLCMLISGGIVSTLVNNHMMEKYRLNKEATMTFLAYSLAPMLEQYDYGQVEQAAKSALLYQQIVSVTVRTPDGKVIRSAVEKGAEAQKTETQTREIMGTESVVGSLEIGFSRKFIQQQMMRTTAALITGLMGFFFIMGFFTYTFTDKSIIRPVRDFTSAVEKLNAENLSVRLDVSGEQEFRKLALSFNSMADHLERSHNALRENEQKFRTLIDTMNDGLAVLDPNGRISYANKRFCEMIGRENEEVIGMSDRDYIHKDSLTPDSNGKNGRKAGGAYDFALLRSDGSKVYTITSGAPLFDAANNYQGSFAVFTDITDRVAAGEELRRSERRFRNIFETNPDAMVITGIKDGMFYDVNEGAAELFGFNRQDAVGKSSVDLGIWVDPEDRKNFVQEIEENGSVKNREVLFRSKEGKDWAALISSRVLELNGEQRLVSTVKNIEELKRAEEALKKSEERFRGYFNQSVAGIAVIYLGRQLIEVNDYICETLGYTREELTEEMKLVAPELSHPDDYKSGREQVEKIINGEIDNYVAIERKFCKNGDMIYVELSVRGVRNDHGKIDYMIVIAKDITERMKAEKALRESERKYRTMFESSADGIFILEGPTFVDCNDETCNMLGRKAGEIIGSNIEDIFSWDIDDEQSAGDVFIQEIEEAEEEKDRVFRIPMSTGDEEEWFEVTLRVIDFADGKMTYGNMRNITEILRAERDQAEQAISTLSEEFTREIESPLEAMQIHIEALKEAVENREHDDLFDFIDEISQQIENISHTMQNFSDFAGEECNVTSSAGLRNIWHHIKSVFSSRSDRRRDRHGDEEEDIEEIVGEGTLNSEGELDLELDD